MDRSCVDIAPMRPACASYASLLDFIRLKIGNIDFHKCRNAIFTQWLPAKFVLPIAAKQLEKNTCLPPNPPP